MKKFIGKMNKALNVRMENIVPDSYIFAALLTIVVYLMGIIIAGQNPFKMITFWYGGFWNFLAFSMQMVLLLVTGFSIATTPVGEKVLSFLGRIPKSSLSAVIFTSVVAGILSYIHWGIGLIGSALLAREVARNLKKLDFKLMVAAIYVGWNIGSMGISGSEPLLVNTPGHFLEKAIGLIPMTQTVLSPMILLPHIVSLLVVLPVFWWMVHPEEKEIPVMDAEIRERFEKEDHLATLEPTGGSKRTIADILEDTPFLNIAIALMGFSYLIYWFATKGFDLNMNIFNFMMLILSVLLHWTPRRFYTAFAEGVKISWGIALQFPFYAGIQGMMASSGLVGIIAGWFIAISNPNTFHLFNYMSTAFMNFFIPSSGGIFIVQGPIMVQAGQALGVSNAGVINAFMAGEVIGNIIQPFWAIPLLAIAGLKMKDIMGVCILSFGILSIVYMVCFTLVRV
jgi:short-chain fatty acids transporter